MYDISMVQEMIETLSQDYEIKNAGSGLIIKIFEPKFKISTEEIKFVLIPKSSITVMTNILKIKTSYTIKSKLSRIAEKSVILNTEKLFNQNISDDGSTWLKIIGENPIKGSAEYSIYSYIDVGVEIYLLDNSGKRIELAVTKNENLYYFNIDVNRISPGMYFLVVNLQNKQFYRKVILTD
jgi:hypothetical protein